MMTGRRPLAPESLDQQIPGMTLGPSPDPRLVETDIETAIGVALGRNTRLHDSHITATAGPEGLVTLTGSVGSHSMRREVEITCWTVPGVRELHNRLVVGRGH